MTKNDHIAVYAFVFLTLFGAILICACSLSKRMREQARDFFALVLEDDNSGSG